MRRALVVLTAVALLGAGTGAATLPRPALSSALTKVVDPVIDALWSRFDLKASADHVRFITGYWRLPGNPGFDATIDRVHARLLASGFRDRVPGAAASPTGPELHIEEYPNPTKGWDHTIGTLAIVRAGRPDEVVLSHEHERIALCINSFSTIPQGVTAKLVDVGKGDQESDYANRDVAGAVVMGDADVAQLWRRGGARALSPAHSANTSIRIRPARRRRRASRGTSCSGAAFRTTRRAKASASKRRRTR
jgi:hypothetical protein